MKTLFRIVSFLEGVSYILLLFIAVPMKYWCFNEKYVKLFGMPHGLLFLAYLFLALMLKSNENWSSKELIIIMTASLIPFGTFFVEIKYFQNRDKAFKD